MSLYFTDVKSFTARKKHTCCWCGTSIDTGNLYSSYTMFDGGTATALRFHPECYDAMMSDEIEEWLPGENNRGCNCFRDADCEHCYPMDTEEMTK